MDGKPRFTVLFDDECPLCLKAVERLSEWDRDHRLTFLGARNPEVEARFPWISREALLEAIHLVDEEGRTWKGAEAVEQLVRVLRGWRWVAWLFRIPLVRPLARWAYSWVARNRYRLRCRDHCGAGGREGGRGETGA